MRRLFYRVRAAVISLRTVKNPASVLPTRHSYSSSEFQTTLGPDRVPGPVQSCLGISA